MDEGPLLDAAEPVFNAFVTMDQNLRFQQNLRGRTLRIIVIRGRSNRLVDFIPAGPQVLDALATMSPGELRTISV